jgi:hypothetical protein
MPFNARSPMITCADSAITSASVHPFRHTFFPHLAMKGAPARAIQELRNSEGASRGLTRYARSLLPCRPRVQNISKLLERFEPGLSPVEQPDRVFRCCGTQVHVARRR